MPYISEQKSIKNLENLVCVKKKENISSFEAK